MKILGTNYYGHDSAIFFLDTKKKNIFSLSTERLTRIKHDNHDISLLLNEYYKIIKDTKIVSNAYVDYKEQKNPYDLHLILLFRKIIKPKYISDLSNIKLKKIIFSFIRCFFLNPKIFTSFFFSIKLKVFSTI